MVDVPKKRTKPNLSPNKKPDQALINKKKKQLVVFAIPVDHRMKIKQSVKTETTTWTLLEKKESCRT